MNKEVIGEAKKLIKELKHAREWNYECVKITGDSISDLLDYINQLEIDNKRLFHNEKVYKDKIKQLETNWNKLNEWLENTLENEKYCYLSENPEDRCRYDVFKEVLSKMQELERGEEYENKNCRDN